MPNYAANSLLDKLRRRTAWFVVLWFAVGLQPCAVAALSELECPHCPEEMVAVPDDTHAHHGHAGGMSGHAHAAAGSPGAPPDCDSGPSDCCEIDTAAVDGRGEPPAPKETGDKLEFTLAALPSVIASSPAFEARPDPPHVARPATGPRLHLIHCVYLD